ncbi:MAG: DegV family protein [Coriobacteriia bacterium]|nr:DegV family protein [Coriobacteriia bacterium]MBN2823537.1 DegV family protein [Coriobacteriia bacterium]
MKDVAVVTESTADLTPEICAEYDISVVELSFTIGDEVYLNSELTQEEFFAKMAESRELPKTSLPSVGAFVETYRRRLQDAESVVSIHVSSALSGTIDAAREAAREFGDRVHVVDSLNLSWGEGLQVIEAARVAASGASWQDVVKATESARDRLRMVVGIDSLENLAKGGRIGRVSQFLGGMLKLRVLFTVNPEGSFAPVARIRGAQAGLVETMRWVTEKMENHRGATFAVMHAMSPEKAEWLRAAIESKFDVVAMYVVKAGPVISTHTGSGWGVALLPEETVDA